MTDLVFLLLIFFMLTSTLVTSRALDLNLPKSNAQTVKRQDVDVSVTKDLRYSVNGTEINVGQLETVIMDAVRGIEEPVIILHADQDIALGDAVHVMDIAYRNRLKIILATDPK